MLAIIAAMAMSGLPSFAQEAPPENHPFIDFDRLELGPRLSALVFGSDFEADPSFGAGIFTRAPMPWLSQDVLGLETDRFGLFAELTISNIERDTDLLLEDPKGSLFFFTLGTDYTLHRDDDVFVATQLALQYGRFGGVTDLDDGIALLGGVMGGVRLSDALSLVVNPQLALGNGDDFIVFGAVGVLIDF
ncbi:MAG: hypothetical protein HYY16_03300 [Planctomycetes bacterium]|nr:hypothetical protein [Planctomycetota bacterium]